MKLLPLLSLMISFLITTSSQMVLSLFQEERWNWTNLHYSYVDLAPFYGFLSAECKNKLGIPFMWGLATSAFQLEGTQTARGEHIKNNWTEWALKKKKPFPGIATDHWNRYKEDIKLLAQTGVNTYRFSIDWSKIEPQEGIFDDEAMAHYVDIILELKKYKIEPMACLFHQTWPLWFDAKGAFEKEENIACFLRFCAYVFDHVHQHVKLWMTLNEPIAYAMSTHFIGKCPPGKIFPFNPLGAGTVFKHYLYAHVAVYQSFKSKDPQAFIGFTDVFNPLYPYHTWHPLERYIARYFESLLHDVTLQFFTTGIYNWMGLVKGENELAPQSLDYIGVNYYSRELINLITLTSIRPDDQLTSKGTAIYPEGLYHSLKRAALFKKPIIIGENGVADTEDTRKDSFIRKHLYAIMRACQDIPELLVCGYFYWTFLDSYGWNHGTERKYGLYHVDFDPNSPTYLQRSLKSGAIPFIQFMHRMNYRF